MPYKDEERKAKQRETSKRWNREHTEKLREYRQTESYKASASKATAKYRKKYPDKALEFDRKHRRKRVDNLADSYIRRLIVQTTPGIQSKDVPQEWIEAKRAAITLKRLLKRIKDEKAT